jgi:uncharacterized membrane protein YraQ (UPF0718 family)
MFTEALWILAAGSLAFSFLKNRGKTKNALRFSWKYFEGMALSVLATVWAIGLLLAFLTPHVIARTIGPESGAWGVMAAAVLGSVVLIPAFIAFPLAGAILSQGASISAVAAFVTTLVMVGILTAPLEAKFFGWRFTLWRNGLSFVFALAIAFMMGRIL